VPGQQQQQEPDQDGSDAQQLGEGHATQLAAGVEEAAPDVEPLLLPPTQVLLPHGAGLSPQAEDLPAPAVELGGGAAAANRAVEEGE
jgi:hypothetical protein